MNKSTKELSRNHYSPSLQVCSSWCLTPLVVVSVFLLTSCSSFQTRKEHNEPSLSYIESNIKTLTSPEMEGRAAGTTGEKKAASFLKEELLSKGLIPYNDSNFEHTFTFESAHTHLAQNPHSNIEPSSSNKSPAIKSGTSILAKIKGKNDHLAPIMLGAHFDHLGTNDSMSPVFYPGADDNASGVSAVLWIIKQLQDEISKGTFKPARDIYFSFWSAEEIGLIGSTKFTSDSFYEGLEHKHGKALLAYLNMDMVGRLRKKLYLQGTGSSLDWKPFIAEAISATQFPSDKLSLSENPLIPTDTTPFYLNNIPVLNAFTGLHSEYHTPEDTSEHINYSGIEDIARLFLEIIKSLSLVDDESISFVKSKNSHQSQNKGIKIYLGTIPDYSGSDDSETKQQGLRISGITPHSPAEKAGLQKNDLVIKLGQKKINNIYDYTEAINSLKAEKPANITIIRDGVIKKLKIIPKIRNNKQ